MDKKIIIGSIITVVVIATGGLIYYKTSSLPQITITVPDKSEINQELANIDLESDLNSLTQDDQDLSDVDSLLAEISQGANFFNSSLLNNEASSVDLSSDLNSITQDDQSLVGIDQTLKEF